MAQGHLVYSLDSKQIEGVALTFEQLFMTEHEWGNRSNIFITLAQMDLTDLPWAPEKGGWTSDRWRSSEWIGFDLDKLEYEFGFQKADLESLMDEWTGGGRWFVVNSGNGLHIWLKVPPISDRHWYSTRKLAYSEVAKELQAKLKEIGLSVEADTQVFRPNMAFRIPYTNNNKNNTTNTVFVLAQNESKTPCTKVFDRIEEWFDALEIESQRQTSSSFYSNVYQPVGALQEAGIKYRPKGDGRTNIVGKCPYCKRKHKAYLTKSGYLKCLRKSCEANIPIPPFMWIEKIGANPENYKQRKEDHVLDDEGHEHRFLDVDDFRERFKLSLPHFFDTILENPLIAPVFAMPPGAGKSFSSREALGVWLNTARVPQRITNIPGQIEYDNPIGVWVVPTHSLASEAEEHFRELGLKVYMLSGKNQSRDEDCLYPGECRLRESLGMSSSRTCYRCVKGPNSGSIQMCQYFKQLFKGASPVPGSVVVTTFASWNILHKQEIYVPDEEKKRSVFADASMVIFDECPEDGHLPTQVIYRTKSPFEEPGIGSLIYREYWPKDAREFIDVLHLLLAPNPKIEWAPEVLAWKVWCEAIKTNPVRGTTFRKLFTALGVRKVGSRENWSALLERVTNLKPGMDSDESLENITELSLPTWVPKLARLLLEHPERLVLCRVNGLNVKVPSVTLTIYDVSRAEAQRRIGMLPSDEQSGEIIKVPCMVLDAYGETQVENWKSLFYDRDVRLEFCRIKSDPKKVEVLWVEQNTSRRYLSIPKNFEIATKELLAGIKRIDGLWTVYTHKANVEKLKYVFKDFPEGQVIIDYYGSARGINTYTGRHIALFGEARKNEDVVASSLQILRGNKPSSIEIRKQCQKERTRSWVEAAYRCRPLTPPVPIAEEKLTILIFSRDKPPSEVIHGVKTEPRKRALSWDLLDELEQFKEANGFIFPLNFYLSFVGKKPNDISTMTDPYNKLYIENGHIVDIIEKNSRNKNKKVFKEILKGMTRIRLDSMILYIKSGTKEAMAETTKEFCETYSFDIPKRVKEILTKPSDSSVEDGNGEPTYPIFSSDISQRVELSLSQSLSNTVQGAVDEKATTACTVALDVEEVSTVGVDDSWDTSELGAFDVVPRYDVVSTPGSSKPTDWHFPKEKVIFVPSQELYSLQI